MIINILKMAIVVIAIISFISIPFTAFGYVIGSNHWSAPIKAASAFIASFVAYGVIHYFQ